MFTVMPCFYEVSNLFYTELNSLTSEKIMLDILVFTLILHFVLFSFRLGRYGGTVLPQSPHSNMVLGLIPGLGVVPFCAEFDRGWRLEFLTPATLLFKVVEE